MKFKPMFDRILVKRLPADESVGGIALPVAVTSLQLMDRGEVVSVGQGRRNEDGVIVRMVLKAGDKVLFVKGTGYQFDAEHTVMHEADVMGTIE